MQNTKTAKISESSEQQNLVVILQASGIAFFAVPNGGKRAKRTAITLKAEGVSPGVPDLLIVDPAPRGGYVGVALEMKRADGVPSDVSADQREWLAKFAARGWFACVGYGADDALLKLRWLGYTLGCTATPQRDVLPAVPVSGLGLPTFRGAKPPQIGA